MDVTIRVYRSTIVARRLIEFAEIECCDSGSRRAQDGWIIQVLGLNSADLVGFQYAIEIAVGFAVQVVRVLGRAIERVVPRAAIAPRFPIVRRLPSACLFSSPRLSSFGSPSPFPKAPPLRFATSARGNTIWRNRNMGRYLK
jgi:hypothetical protein